MKRIKRKSLSVLVFALAFVLAQSALALAQATGSSNTTIKGHVKDPKGASLPGASVKLYARERSFHLSTTTDSTGAYRFEKLAPGEYLVEAEAEGFASASAQRVTVKRGQAVTLDIPLELAGVRSTVGAPPPDTREEAMRSSKPAPAPGATTEV